MRLSAHLKVVLTVLLPILLFSGGAVARCFGVPESKTGDILWSVRVRAASDLGHADEGVFGVAPGATNLFEPSLDEFEPVASEEVGLRLFFFLEQVLKFPPAKFNKSFIAPGDRMDWVMRVEYLDTRASRVTLTWDVESVRTGPDPVTLRLQDGLSTVDMLSVESYTYNATTGTRSFRIVAEPAAEEGSLLPIVLVLAVYVAALGAYLLLRRRHRLRREGGG
jgi:hypothetical protein